VKDAKQGSEPEPKELEHGAKVIADPISPPSDVIDFKAGPNCGEVQITIEINNGFEFCVSSVARATLKKVFCQIPY
jgi:hypothetical protein